MNPTNRPPVAWFQRLCPTPLGSVRLLASHTGLAGLWFEDQKHRPQALDGAWPHDAGHGLLDLAQAQLAQYFDGQRRRFDLPLDFSAGTPFQQMVWHALLDIDAGRTCSYTELAQRIGRPRSARAVGAAVGRNRLSVIVPCHRVVGQDGRLTGYAGGLERKRALLALEGSA
jgi:methylated-DNA-[protein]-cysteine S-methyltransferase